MAMRLNPYINFRDQARDALQFYHQVLGGDMTMTTFAEGGMAQDPAEGEKIMHGQIDTPDGFTLMVSDTPPGMPLAQDGNIAISLSGDDEPDLRRYWDGLADGGQVALPLEKAPWGDTFGMVRDRFGINWMVNILGRGH
jgi:PhnB protein